MAETGKSTTGQCLCARVTYEVPGPVQGVLQCHCENCRRLSGNFVAAAHAPTAELTITDPDDMFSWFDLGYAKYGFCRGCGSTLFYRAADREDATAVMVGTLDDSSDLALEAIWYADDAQPHNSLSPDVPHYQGNA